MGYKLALLGTVAVLVQSISGQCYGNQMNGPVRGFGNGLPYSSNLAGNTLSYGSNVAGVKGPLKSNLGIGPGPVGQPGYAASTGGSFAVTSSSLVSPTGVSVLAENLAIEGPLNIGGNLPFLGTVGVEGSMPNTGSGSVSYGCGSGSVGIIAENTAGIGPYGSAGSFAGPALGSMGSNSALGYGSAVSPALGSYGAPAVSGGFGLGGSALGGSPIGPTGLGFGSGLGFNGFNGLRK